jgi:hypothetical protein
VNEKIDKLHEMLERQNEKTDAVVQQLASHLEKEGLFQVEIRAHMEEVKPFLQGAQGLKVIRNFLYWVGGLFVMWVAFRNSIKL